MAEEADSHEKCDPDLESQPNDAVEDICKDNGLSTSALKRKLDNNGAQDSKKLKGGKKKFKQPTPEELNNFREVENLYNSYLLKSEVEDLLKSNTYKDSKRLTKCSKFDEWFNELTSALKNMVEYEPVKPSEFIKGKDKNKKKMRAIQLFFNEMFAFIEDYTLCDDNTICSFAQPKSINVFGGFKSGACLKADFLPNVLVKMPRSAFYEKDFLNNRYLVKRFHYLLYIMYELKKKPFIKQIEVGKYQDNELIKILRITPSYDPNVKIQLFVVPEQDTFKLPRMEPNRNNFKVNVFQNINPDFSKFNGKPFGEMDISKFTTIGTPNYNTHLLHDFTLEENNKQIEMILQEYVCCQDAIKLLLLWLKNRQLNANFTAFTKELLIYTIIYLIQKKKVNKHMSSYQVARIFFIFINETDWRVKPISLSSATDFTAFTDKFDIVFTDYSGYYNVAGFLNASFYDKLRFEAATALQILNKDVIRAFMSLFNASMSVVLQYDCIVYFNDDDCFQTVFEQYTSEEIKWKYFGCYEQLITKQFTELLKYGLGNRMQYIVPLHLKPKNAPIKKKIVKTTENPIKRVVFGLKLNEDKALNPLIIGPQQYDPEAKKFNEFWEDLVSLRRFANTSIHEAVLFDNANTVADKRNICARILEFIANKVNANVEIISNQFEQVVRLTNMRLPFNCGTNEEATKFVQATTDDFFKKIRKLTLKEITLQSLQCVSDVYCGTDPFPPIANNFNSGKEVTLVKDDSFLLQQESIRSSPTYVPVVECIMHIDLLDKSHYDCLSIYKAALAMTYHCIATSLTTTQPIGSHSSNGYIIAKATLNYVDVLFRGIVFRLRAFNNREVSLLKRTKNDRGQVVYRSNADSISAERKATVEPAVYGALNGLLRQYPCYGTATAIAKRWMRSQLLQQIQINDMTINLLMAAIFLTPEPFDRPTLPQLAFLQFLRFLAEFPFDQLPVVLNFHGELSKEDVMRVESDFIEKREIYNPVHILMSYDLQKSVFTSPSPDNMIIRRLKNISIDLLRSVNACINEQESIFPEHYFVPNIEGYHIIIRLYSKLNSKKHMKVLHKTKPITITEHNGSGEIKFPIVAYSPVDNYINILEKQYGTAAYFFYDPYGGNVINVLWKTGMMESIKAKLSSISGDSNCVNNKLSFDVQSVIEDFITMGCGLVKNVQNC